jgi:hypothetical protein
MNINALRKFTIFIGSIDKFLGFPQYIASPQLQGLARLNKSPRLPPQPQGIEP